MSLDLHTVSVISGSDLAQTDRLRLSMLAVAYGVGGSAGAAVTVAVAGEFGPLYKVVGGAHADAIWYTTAETATGFNLVVSPRLAANTLAAGTVDLLIVG